MSNENFQLTEQISGCIVARNLLNLTGIQDILDLEGITEVAVNQPNVIWFDRGHGWELKKEPRCSYENCEKLANALAVFSNDNDGLSYNNPIASVTLPDGERGQIMMPPATEKGCISFTLRKPSTKRRSLDEYQKTGRLELKDQSKKIQKTEITKKLGELRNQGKLYEFLSLAVKSNLNILLVGGTGSGKTTIMKALVDIYPREKRIFTIEDVHEVDLPNHPNHVHLFYKGRGNLTPKRIIESCMRMKPDHVLLAELRGDEAWNYLEMLNTGHAGSITTIHANDCVSAKARLVSLIKQSDVGKTLDYQFIMKTVESSIDVICFFKHTYLTDLYFPALDDNNEK